MSQFDQTTALKGEEAAKSYAREMGGFPKGFTVAGVNGHTRGWDEGRSSVKESLALLAMALERFSPLVTHGPEDYRIRANAIAAVKERGDWPLEVADT